jgi:glycosyltransferase involved in cell wall biosynthesis
VSAPRRISFVTTSLMRGGAETQVYLLARTLRERGHEVQIVTMTPPQAYVEETREHGIELVDLGMRTGVPDPRGLARLVRAWRAFAPDVAHAHMIHAVLLARLGRPFARVPVLVSTAHNLTEGARWRELAYRWTDRLGDLTTNVCQAAVDRYVRVGAAPAGRIVRMPNGIEVAAFGPDPAVRERLRGELGLGADRFAWLAVGRLEEQKDVPTLLQAATRLPASAVTLLVGEGPLRAELEARRDALGLSAEQVRFLGARSDVADLLRAVDGYAMSSAWEGLPLVLLEAAASGLPIVATRVGGNDEIVEDGATGRLVPSGDPEALAAAMSDTMTMPPERRAAWGRAGRARIEREFDIERVVDAWSTLYASLWNDRGKGPTRP